MEREAGRWGDIMMVKDININRFNRIYHILKTKRFIRLADERIKRNTETINKYLALTDPGSIAECRKYYEAVRVVQVVIDAKSRWEPLLADLRLDNVASIHGG